MPEWNRVAERHFDKLARAYDTMDRSEGGAAVFFDIEHGQNLLWDTLARHLPGDRDAPILELGPGTGRWTLRILDAGYRNLTCLDISTRMLRILRGKIEQGHYSAPPRIVHGDVSDLSMLADETFAFVLQIGEAFAGADPLTCLCQARRVSLPNGKLFFSADNLLPSILFLIADGEVDRAEAALQARELICFQPHRKTYWPPDRWHRALADTGWRPLATYAGSVMENWIRAFAGTTGFRDVDHRHLASELGKEALTPFEQAFAREPGLLGLSHVVFYLAENAPQRQGIGEESPRERVNKGT